MSENSKIEWCDSSWNPIRGQNARHTCARISPGCTNCYAATMTKRGLMGTASIDYGMGETLNDPARLDEAALLQPLRWKKPRRVFVCSMTDIAGRWVPDHWLDAIWCQMAAARQHTYLVLTKRPARLWQWFQSDSGRTWAANIQPNVQIGVSVELDRYAWRANILREIPSGVRWISAEPLLSGLPSLNLTGIDWVVTGGESGPGARPMHPRWAMDLRDRCAENDVAFFHKQNGEYAPVRPYDDFEGWHHGEIVLNLDGNDWRGSEALIEDGAVVLRRVGRKAAGRVLAGQTWNEYPEPQRRVAAGGS